MKAKTVSISFILLFVMYQTGYSQQENSVFDAIRNNDIVNFQESITNDKTIINKKNGRGFTPLILASYYNRLEMVKALIAKNADIDTNSPMGTALMAATYKGNTDIVKTLLEHHANVNIPDENGTTALHYACFLNNTEIATLILDKNPNTNSKDNKGKTPLDYAILNDNITIIKHFNHE